MKFSVDIGHNAHAFLLFQYDARSDQRFLSIGIYNLTADIDGGDAVRYALRTQHDGTVRLIFNFDFFALQHLTEGIMKFGILNVYRDFSGEIQNRVVVEESDVSQFADFVQNLFDAFVGGLYRNLLPHVLLVSGCPQVTRKEQYAQGCQQKTTGRHAVW